MAYSISSADSKLDFADDFVETKSADKMDLGNIAGLVLIGIAVVFQCVCLFIMRIINRTEPRSRTVVMKMWIHLSVALDQLSFFTFHLKYHFLPTDFDDSTSCIVLRFLSSFTSTFSMMWILVLAGFYLMITVKPSKCYSFHVEFLSNCAIWVWSCTSCLIYLIIAYLVQAEYSKKYIQDCWSEITGKIHFYLTYGNEVIPFVFAFVFSICARFRWTNRRQVFMLHTNRRPEVMIELLNLRHKMNLLIALGGVYFCYYFGVTIRFALVESGSDWVLMILQSLKGFSVGILLCLCEREVISILRLRYHTPDDLVVRNGEAVNSGVIPTIV